MEMLVAYDLELTTLPFPQGAFSADDLSRFTHDLLALDLVSDLEKK